MAKGYAKMLIASYPLFNLTATNEFNNRYDSGCQNYTYY
jgi:hypothetical protein